MELGLLPVRYCLITHLLFFHSVCSWFITISGQELALYKEVSTDYEIEQSSFNKETFINHPSTPRSIGAMG